MKDRDQKCYLCVSGEVKRRAEKHRKVFLRLRAKLWKVVESFGSDTASICDTMMLIRGITFDRKQGAPPGWTKPSRYDGTSRPKHGTVSPEIQAFFTPGGTYCIETHAELKPFREWLKCPLTYSWKSRSGGMSGSSTIGRIFRDGFVYWFDPKGPIMLELPDVAGAKARAKKEKQIVEGNVLDWTPPKGLKEILPEEWELMVAKHKLAKKAR